MPINDVEDMSFVIGRDLEGNPDDSTPVKHLQQAVAHLYKRVHALQDEVEGLRSQIRDLENP
jgi:hypothetical protein